MKKIIILFTIFLTFSSVAQITLRHTYNESISDVELSSSGFKFYHVDKVNNQLKFYNTNHTLWKTVNISIPSGYRLAGVNYISEELFDTDNSNIEFLVSYYDTVSYIYTTQLRDQNGNTFMTFPSSTDGYSIDKINNQWTLLILYNGVNNTDIYDLPGSYPISYLAERESGNATFLENPYPNPSLNQIKLPYSLPIGTNQAKLKIYNTSGQLIESLTIDDSFDHVLLDVTSYQQGSYVYKIEADGTVSNTKTFIKTN